TEHVEVEPGFAQVVLLEELATDEPAGLADRLFVGSVGFRRQVRGRPGRKWRDAQLDPLLHEQRVEQGIQITKLTKIGTKLIDRGRGTLCGQRAPKPVVGLGREGGRRRKLVGVEHRLAGWQVRQVSLPTTTQRMKDGG